MDISFNLAETAGRTSDLFWCELRSLSQAKNISNSGTNPTHPPVAGRQNRHMRHPVNDLLSGGLCGCFPFQYRLNKGWELLLIEFFELSVESEDHPGRLFGQACQVAIYVLFSG